MPVRRFRSLVKVIASLLSAACFLAFGQGAVSTALAADPPVQTPQASTWETWPRKPVVGTPGATPGAAAAGETAGAKTFAGLSGGTWGWIAGGAAAIALGAVVAGGGGGGGNSGTTHTVPAH